VINEDSYLFFYQHKADIDKSYP